jgi:antirestriction protein
MSYGDDVQCEDIIQMSDVAEFLRYIDDLTEQAADEDATAEVRQEGARLLAEYDPDRIAELRALLKNSEDYGDESAISERYFKRYASDYANDVYSLDGTGASAYFDYDAFAADYQSDFSEFEYDGVTYYMR